MTTSELEIVEVDVDDDAQVTAWHAAMESACREGLGRAASLWTLPEMLIDLREPSRRRAQSVFVGLDAEGEVHGASWVSAPLLDNLQNADLEVYVPPEHRRRGHGTRLLAHAERVARGFGRTNLQSEASWPHDLGSDGGGWPGREFARAHGYELVLSDVQRVVDLPVDPGLLERLAAETAPHHTAYTLRTWVGPIPDDLVVGWLTLSATLITEAPTGDKQLEPEAVDVEALRESEAKMAKQGRTRYNTVALDAAGDVVAYTDVVSTPHEPGRSYQWGTLVRAADRGHRLGLAVKVANLQLIQRERDDLREVVTFNAEVNQHMIGVNERLGFREVARLGEFEKRA